MHNQHATRLWAVLFSGSRAQPELETFRFPDEKQGHERRAHASSVDDHLPPSGPDRSSVAYFVFHSAFYCPGNCLLEGDWEQSGW